jgi:methionine synthase I (cobalamin-dependent)/5,10-methylenetetrahydrofolate reductase
MSPVVTQTETASPFLAALERKVLLSDGAMGTLLHDAGVPADVCPELTNLERPELVRRVHLDYIDAGADLIQTNTFGANRVRLGAFGLAERLAEINRAAVRLARGAVEGAGRPVFVAGDVGPLGERVTPQEAHEAFAEQMVVLAAEGVDLFLLQTFTALEEALVAVRAARATAPGVPVVAEMSFIDGRRTFEGLSPAKAGQALREAGADLVGANCGNGPAEVLLAVRELAAVPGLRVIAQPSAGRPLLVQRRVVYQATAEFMAGYARRFLDAGAVIVGGCCGTSPRHIGAMRRAIDAGGAAVRVLKAPGAEPAGRPAPKSLRAKLAAGRFVVSVEIDPPRGLGVRRAVEGAVLMRERGADCVNVGDSPMAEVRMSAIAMAALLKQQAEVEPIVHFSTRDRNVMALQADLLGAHALGLRNVLCIKGDPHALGRYTKAAAVWDVNALGLIRIIQGFNAGHDAIGTSVRPPARFLAGAAVNPMARDPDAEVRLVRRKIEAGARFFLSQAIFDADALERFLERLGEPPAPIIVGVWPLHTARQAAFLNEKVVPVPATVRAALERAGTDGEEAGLELAARLLERVRPLAQGVYFVPSFGRYEGVGELVAAARELGDRRA